MNKKQIAKNPFKLYEDDDSEALREECTKDILKLIWSFKDGYNALKNKKYPDTGLGDTETDELVSQTLYDIVHCDAYKRPIWIKKNVAMS